MRARICECGECRVCRNRLYRAAYRERNLDRIRARNAAWAREKQAPKPPRPSYAVTVEQAEEMEMGAWLRLPEAVERRIVRLYLSERTQA